MNMNAAPHVFLSTESFFVLCLFLCLGIIIWIYFQHRKLQIVSNAAFNTAGYALVFFDGRGRLYRKNKLAETFFESRANSDNLNTLSRFMEWVNIRSVPIDETLEKTIEKVTSDLMPREEIARNVVRLDDGKLYFVVAQKIKTDKSLLILIDINQQRMQDEDIYLMGEANYQLEQAIETTNIGILISMPAEENNPISYANNAFCEIVDIPRQEIIGNLWGRICEAFEEDNVDDLLTEAFYSNAQKVLSLSRTYEGRKNFFNLTITPVFDKDAEVNLFIGILKNVTEEKLREAEFNRAQKLDALGQLSAGIAHDFNNLLSIIDGYARLLEKRIHDTPEECEDYARRIVKASQRGEALTRRMLTFSRHKIVTEQVHELTEILKDQQILLDAVINPSIKMSFEIIEEDLYVECAPDFISQILMNLVINARDALDKEGGSIKIRLDAPMGFDIDADFDWKINDLKYARLIVQDNGQGISPETLEKIFDPFFTTKREDKGTGLGLSVVYGLVQDMNGHICVESVQGEGTSFNIYFPISHKRPSKTLSDNIDEPSTLRLEGYTAIVVDDEEDILKITASVLRDSGMTVIEASSGDDALLVQDDHEGDIDIMITDVLMPDLNGVKLAEMMQALRPDIKVIFMSGYPSNKEMQNISMPEDAQFIAKPVDMNKMLALIYGILSGKINQNDDDDFGRVPDHWSSKKD